VDVGHREFAEAVAARAAIRNRSSGVGDRRSIAPGEWEVVVKVEYGATRRVNPPAASPADQFASLFLTRSCGQRREYSIASRRGCGRSSAARPFAAACTHRMGQADRILDGRQYGIATEVYARSVVKIILS
jgi:hypothetical protein